MGLIGPSGAGKTTIFKMLALMEKRDLGNIQLNGISINKYYEDYSKIQELDIGIVFEEDVLWLDKTVDENLAIVGKLRGINKNELTNRILFIKNLLFLEEHKDKKAYKLSGGNKRKLCCAMALLAPPQILLLDEISNGVDPLTRKNLYTYLNSLKETTIFLITHRIDEAEKICD